MVERKQWLWTGIPSRDQVRGEHVMTREGIRTHNPSRSRSAPARRIRPVPPSIQRARSPSHCVRIVCPNAYLALAPIKLGSA
jgi:hypothetical protein